MSRAAIVSARDALASYWKTAVVVGVIALTAIGAFASVGSVHGRRTGLRVNAPAETDVGLRWTKSAVAPWETQADAVDSLYSLLMLTAWSVVAVAATGALAVAGARAAERRADLAVRRAVGAGRRAVIGAALIEGAIIGGAAIGLGTTIGAVGASVAARSWPGEPAGFGLAGAPLLLLIGGAVVISALIPLLSLRRRIVERSPVPPSLGLAAAQLALSLTILVGAALVRERAAEQVARSEQPSSALGLVYQVSSSASPTDRSRRYAELLDSLAVDPAVELASLSSPGTLVGLGTVDHLTTDCGRCSVGGIFLPWRVVRAVHHFATADTFTARGLVVSEGRNFTRRDDQGGEPVAIVNRYLAARYFQNGQAVGRGLWLGGGLLAGRKYKVIGVVDDPRPVALGGGLLPLEAVYLSTLQFPGTRTELLIRDRTAVDGRSDVPVPPGRDRAAAPCAVVTCESGPIPASALEAREAAPLAWFARWLGIEGAIVLALAVLGMAATMRLWVDASLPEMALRRAVGARRIHVIGLVLARAGSVGVRALPIALALFAPFLWSGLAAILPGLSIVRLDLVGRYGAMLMGAALLAAILPAARAARAAPTAYLRRF